MRRALPTKLHKHTHNITNSTTSLNVLSTAPIFLILPQNCSRSVLYSPQSMLLLLRDIGSAWLKKKNGQALLACWIGVAGIVTYRSIKQAREPKKNAANAQNKESTKEFHPVVKQTNLKSLMRICVPSKSCGAAGWFIMVAAGISARVIISMRLFGEYLATQQWKELFLTQLRFATLCIPAAAMNSYLTFSGKRLALSMRKNMHEWMLNLFAKRGAVMKASISVDDTAQRATQDIDKFTEKLASIFNSMCKPLVEVLLLSWKLSSKMGKLHLLQCYMYFIVSGYWIRKVTPSFAAELTSTMQQGEGLIHRHHNRNVDYAEEIELLGGQATEVGVIKTEFSQLYNNIKAFSSRIFFSDSVNSYFVRYMGILAAFTTMLPKVYYEKGSKRGPNAYFLTCLHLLVEVGMAFKALTSVPRQLNEARGLGSRIEELGALLTRPNPLSRVAQGSRVKFSSVLLVVPSLLKSTNSTANGVPFAADLGKLQSEENRVLVKGLSFSVAPGQRLFVSGPNGSGKSSIFRAMRGIWPVGIEDDGSVGSITVPPSCDCVYVPQRPYFPAGLSLSQQLHYPRIHRRLPDLVLIDALRVVGLLEILRGRAGASFTHNTHKATVEKLKVGPSKDKFAKDDPFLRSPSFPLDGLSVGEQQRLALARLLVAAPRFAFLDECTSACSRDFEESFFQRCLNNKIGLITISHRQELKKFHTHCLTLHNNKTYVFEELVSAAD